MIITMGNITVRLEKANVIFVLQGSIVLILPVFLNNAKLVFIQKLDLKNANLVKMVTFVNSKRK